MNGYIQASFHPDSVVIRVQDVRAPRTNHLEERCGGVMCKTVAGYDFPRLDHHTCVLDFLNEGRGVFYTQSRSGAIRELSLRNARGSCQ